jgi:hypothetical protein
MHRFKALKGAILAETRRQFFGTMAKGIGGSRSPTSLPRTASA